MNHSDRRYWMHRIAIDRAAKEMLLNENGLLMTSWNDIASNEFLDAARTSSQEAFTYLYGKSYRAIGVEGAEKRKNRFCLYVFLHEFKKGDYVIVPGTGNFSVYEILGEHPFSKESLQNFKLSDPFLKEYELKETDWYEKKPGEKLDFGFFWEVKLVEKDISKSKYVSNAIQRRLKYQMTNIEMTDLKEDIESAIERKRANNPLDLFAEIKDRMNPIVLDKLKTKINHSGFEEIIRQYLESMGARATRLSTNNLPANEGDVDIVANFDELQITILVQAKQHDKEVDDKAVEQIIKGSKRYQDNDEKIILWVVSTCEIFTDEAIRMAEENDVRLIGGEEFASMLISQFGKMKELDKAFVG